MAKRKDIAVVAIATLSTASGLACLYGALYVWTPSNWRPVELPLPSPGIEVAAPFQLSTGGRFQFQVKTPDLADPAAAGFSQQPDVTCRIQIAITGANGQITKQVLDRFRHGGRDYFGKIDYYFDSRAPFALPRGQYTVRVRTESDAVLFRAQGAILELERVAEPSGAAVFGMLLRGLSFALVVVGLVIFVAHGLAARG